MIYKKHTWLFARIVVSPDRVADICDRMGLRSENQEVEFSAWIKKITLVIAINFIKIELNHTFWCNNRVSYSPYFKNPFPVSELYIAQVVQGLQRLQVHTYSLDPSDLDGSAEVVPYGECHEETDGDQGQDKPVVSIYYQGYRCWSVVFYHLGLRRLLFMLKYRHFRQ